jgi:GNAT superfamily N-acetyltransferase
MDTDSEKVALTREDPSSPDCLRLIAQLSAELGELYGDDGGANSYNPHEPLASGAAFLVARVEGQPVGCGAIRPFGPGVGEVKRMFVVPEARGRGISRLLLQEIESAAVEMGYRTLRLETGIRQPEAIGLYDSAGYRRAACYGYYANDPRSVCFEKTLGSSRHKSSRLVKKLPFPG